MALDSYSLCPGGRGKKIRFCCPDHLKDLEQIDKMIEGEQFAAGLSFVENLEKERPDCACLTEAKCVFQRMIGLWEDEYETATKFAAREPKNVVAQSELATAAALTGKPEEAISALVDAIESVEEDQFPLAVVQAMLTVGATLYESGYLFQAIAVAKQLQAFAPKDRASNEFLYRCLGDESIPLMLKELVFDLEAPADFPKKDEYAEAVRLLSRGSWKKGRAIFETLLPFGENWPNLFRNLGIVSLWFAEEDKARAYFDRYLASAGVDPEDAIDNIVFQATLTTPSWDGVETMVKRVYALDNFDAAFEKLLSSRVFSTNQRLLAAVAELEVPPKTAFDVASKPAPDSFENVKLDDMPTQIGFAFVYGKQTDRAARLEAFALPEDFAAVEAALTATLGFLPTLESEEPQEGQSVLWTANASLPRFQLKQQSAITPETIERLFDEHLVRFVDRWFERPYSVLNGKAAKDAIAEPDGARRVEALIRLVEGTFAAPYSDKIGKLLRAKVGLPAPKPIAPPATFATKEDALAFFRSVPLWRWNRIEIDKCETPALVELLQVANLVAPRDVKEKFATEALKRPTGEMEYDDRAIAFAIVIDAAVLARDTERALELIADATKYAADMGRSDSQWNTLEFMTRVQRGEYDRLRELANHIFAEHQDDQQAIQTLQAFFARLNAAQQAQAAYGRRAAAAQQPAQAPAAVGGIAGMGGAGVGGVSPLGSTPFSATQRPAQEEKPSSGLWTPGSDSPKQSGNGGGSKLWLPD